MTCIVAQKICGSKIMIVLMHPQVGHRRIRSPGMMEQRFSFSRYFFLSVFCRIYRRSVILSVPPLIDMPRPPLDRDDSEETLFEMSSDI